MWKKEFGDFAELIEMQKNHILQEQHNTVMKVSKGCRPF